MREKIESYKKALELVKVLGQSILSDSYYLSEELTNPIEEIDINIHYILDLLEKMLDKSKKA